MSATGQWYWCLKHHRVEPADGCRAEDRMGPYDSPEAAEHWKETVEARNQSWDEADEAWERGAPPPAPPA